MSLSRRAFCACCGALAAAWPLAASAQSASEGLPEALELGVKDMQRIGPTVWVAPLAPYVWLHTTTALIEGGVYYPANGLILERQGGSLLIDTAYEPEHAETLVAWSAKALSAPITEAVGTHFHNDRIGGITGLERRRIPTRAHPLTCELAGRRGMPAPQPIQGFEAGAVSLGEDVELFFPGPGHTWDNITAWLPGHGVLFGGCFLKSETSPSLGNLADADLGQWSGSLERLAARYPEPKVVVPGHGTVSGDPIGRTRALLAKHA